MIVVHIIFGSEVTNKLQITCIFALCVYGGSNYKTIHFRIKLEVPKRMIDIQSTNFP
jgi:hypothetical protein